MLTTLITATTESVFKLINWYILMANMSYSINHRSLPEEKLLAFPGSSIALSCTCKYTTWRLPSLIQEHLSCDGSPVKGNRKTYFKLLLDRNNIAAKTNIAINLNRKQQWKKQKTMIKIYTDLTMKYFFSKLPNESNDMNDILFFCFGQW